MALFHLSHISYVVNLQPLVPKVSLDDVTGTPAALDKVLSNNFVMELLVFVKIFKVNELPKLLQANKKNHFLARDPCSSSECFLHLW